MSEKPEDEREPRSEQRIAELEAEVSRLRGELASGAAPDPVGQTGKALPDPGGPMRAEDNLAPSRTKMILVAIGIAIVALAGFALVFSALSSGFDSLARKAAKSFSPDDPGAGSGSSPEPNQKPAKPSLPRAPGL